MFFYIVTNLCALSTCSKNIIDKEVKGKYVVRFWLHWQRNIEKSDQEQPVGYAQFQKKKCLIFS